MEEYIDVDCRTILECIKLLDISAQYAACSQFLDLIRPYFLQYKLHFKEKYFFRVRSHMEGGGEYYFKNISDISYRTDFFNISKFGRCNCPFEAVFYCSDNPLLSITEVSELTRLENRKEINFYTTSVWKTTQELSLTPIFERQSRIDRNEKMVEITNRCLQTIDGIKAYSKKEQLKEFHRAIGNEFTKPCSIDRNIYLLSSAISGYLLNEKRGQSAKSTD